MKLLLAWGAIVITVACSGPVQVTYRPESGSAEATAYQMGEAVASSAEAVAAARHWMESPGFQWLEPPRVRLAEEMSYAGAVERIGLGEGEYDIFPADLRVWMVILQGRWQLMPMDPGNANPKPVIYEGCGMAVVAARDGTLISMGDAVCPPG